MLHLQGWNLRPMQLRLRGDGRGPRRWALGAVKRSALAAARIATDSLDSDHSFYRRLDLNKQQLIDFIYHRKGRHNLKKFRWLICASLALLANFAFATTYTYTGPQYTTATGLYTTSMRVAGNFTTASPLPANMPITNIGPSGGSNLVTSWSFSDGVSTYTDATTVVLYGLPNHFAISTDATGNVSAFDIGFMSPGPPNTVGQIMNGVFSSSGPVTQATTAQPCAAVIGVTCANIVQGGTNFASANTLGVWQVGGPPAAATSIPTLSQTALILLAMSIAMLAHFRRRQAS